MSTHLNLEDARRHDAYIETHIIHRDEACELVKVYGNKCLHYNLTGAEKIKYVTYCVYDNNRIQPSENKEFSLSEMDSFNSHLDWVTSRKDTHNIRVEDTYRLAVTATRDLWADWARMERPCLYWP